MSDTEHRPKIRRRKYQTAWYNKRTLMRLAKGALRLVALVVGLYLVKWSGAILYGRWEQNSLLAQADQYVAQKDLAKTGECLQSVLKINPNNVTANVMMADLLETEKAPAALAWRKRVVSLEPGRVARRFEWAKTAIRLNNFAAAQEALTGVGEPDQATAEYHKIAGALAWNLGQTADAEQHYAEASRLEPDNPANVLNLQTIRMASTNRDLVATANLSLEQLATNTDMGPVALQHLLEAAIARRDLTNALAYAKEIAGLPAATMTSKVQYLQLLHAAKQEEFVPLLATLQTAASHSPEDVYTLGKWMAAVESPTAVLHWVQDLPGEIQTNLPVPLLVTDCQMSLKEWARLLAFVDHQYWDELEYYRQALECLAERSLGNDIAAQNHWANTKLLTQGRLDRLARLSQIVEKWGWTAEQDEVLHQITDQFPNQTWAVNRLMANLYQTRNTLALQELLAKLHADNPGDTRIKNNLANILLLRKVELSAADALAKEAYETATNDPYFMCTYGYSLLLQKKPGEALDIINRLNPADLQVASFAAIYGAIQAAAGDKALARKAISRTQGVNLLPEEEALVSQTKALLTTQTTTIRLD